MGKEYFLGLDIGTNSVGFVNGDSVNEYLHPSKNIDLDTRKAKSAAAGELDNLLDAGARLPNEADGRDGHIHPDAIDFSYYKTVFKVGDEYFEGIINIKNIRRGSLLKDITKIKNITEDIVSSYGTNPKSNFLRDASIASIRPNSQNVNPEDTLFSSRNVRDAEYLKLAEDPEDNRIELEDMVFSEAERKGYLYRRNTFAEHSAVKGTPWQMFVKGLDANLDGYGEYAYVATDKGATPIEEIMPALRSLAEEYYGSDIDDDEINPPDIIMSAGVWDDIGFVQYIWDNYFEGEADRTGEIPAIVTEDGMMVMDIDEKRVKSAAAVEYDNNGNIIPLSQRFDSEAEDIRFSQRSAAQLERDSDGNNLTEAASPVKLKFGNVTESQQFKRWFGDWQNDPANASKVVNGDGTPKVVYHQTGGLLTVFDTRREGAGSRDEGTPFGIFLKSSDRGIGLSGKFQMGLYADITPCVQTTGKTCDIKSSNAEVLIFIHTIAARTFLSGRSWYPYGIGFSR